MPQTRTPFQVGVEFWLRVDVRRPDECWRWTGYTDPGGYGRTYYKGALHLAHRLAYLLRHGLIPEGKCVLHDCPSGDLPTCCNPQHLWIGTQQDNVADRDCKGRRPPPLGIINGRAKLTDEYIIAIRKDYCLPKVNCHTLGLRYSVAPSTIRLIIKHKTWKHLL